MADTYDLKTKIPIAIKALIVGTGTGTVDNVFPGEASQTQTDRPLPNTTIECDEGFEEDLQPGNFRFTGKIMFRDDGTTQPNDGINKPFLRAQQRVSAIITQLVLSDDDTTKDYTRRQLNYWGRLLATSQNPGDPVADSLATINQDMTDFTFIYWNITDYGSPKKSEGTFIERDISFECVACNANID